MTANVRGVERFSHREVDRTGAPRRPPANPLPKGVAVPISRLTSPSPRMNPVTSRRTFVKTAAWTSAAWLAAARSVSSAAQPGQAAASAPAVETVPLAPPDAQPPHLPLPEAPARKIGYAIVGLGELALEQVMPAFREARLSEPVALVSGHREKARQVAKVYAIRPEAIYGYDNFERIADDPRIEAVYIILPNSLHAEFTVRALQAGKHVFCEKPMATSPAECERMIAAAREAKRKLAIAYRLHYEPKTIAAAKLLRAGAIGKPKTFASSNCQTTTAPNIRLSKALGGGPIGDIGIYSINTARFLLGEDPVEVSATQHQPADDPRFREVPESVAFTMRFRSGVLASCDCSFSSTESRRWRLHGTQGFLEMDPAFSYKGLRLRAQEGEAEQSTARLSELLVADQNQFASELDDFSECLLQNREPRTPGEIGLVDLKIIAALQESIATGRSVRLA